MKTTLTGILITICLTLIMGTAQVYASDAGGTLRVGVDTGLGGVVKAAPSVSPAPGTYTSIQSVALAAAGSSAIYYTVDGTTTPTTSSTLYTGAISVAVNMTMKAKAY